MITGTDEQPGPAPLTLVELGTISRALKRGRVWLSMVGAHEPVAMEVVAEMEVAEGILSDYFYGAYKAGVLEGQ